MACLRVSAVLFCWSNDQAGDRNVRRLIQVVDLLGYSYLYINEVDLGINTSQCNKEMDTAAIDWFNRWLESEPEKFGHDPKDNLLIFFYFGHAGQDREVDQDGQGYPPLAASLDEFWTMSFDLTALRQFARDHTEADFLCGLECCFGDTDDLSSTESLPFSHNKIMETVAAGEGMIAIAGDNIDWSQRYADHLQWEWKSGIKLSVRKRSTLAGLGFRRRNAGTGSIVLPHLIEADDGL